MTPSEMRKKAAALLDSAIFALHNQANAQFAVGNVEASRRLMRIAASVEEAIKLESDALNLDNAT